MHILFGYKCTFNAFLILFRLVVVCALCNINKTFVGTCQNGKYNMTILEKTRALIEFSDGGQNVRAYAREKTCSANL